MPSRRDVGGIGVVVPLRASLRPPLWVGEVLSCVWTRCSFPSYARAVAAVAGVPAWLAFMVLPQASRRSRTTLSSVRDADAHSEL